MSVETLPYDTDEDWEGDGAATMVDEQIDASDQNEYTGSERREGDRKDRRDADRRDKAGRRSGLDRRRGPGRRRAEIRKMAEEGEMGGELLEFIKSIEEYKRVNGKPFPSWSEVYELILYLGYRKVADKSDHINSLDGRGAH